MSRRQQDTAVVAAVERAAQRLGDAMSAVGVSAVEGRLVASRLHQSASTLAHADAIVAVASQVDAIGTAMARLAQRERQRRVLLRQLSDDVRRLASMANDDANDNKEQLETLRSRVTAGLRNVLSAGLSVVLTYDELVATHFTVAVPITMDANFALWRGQSEGTRNGDASSSSNALVCAEMLRHLDVVARHTQSRVPLLVGVLLDQVCLRDWLGRVAAALGLADAVTATGMSASSPLGHAVEAEEARANELTRTAYENGVQTARKRVAEAAASVWTPTSRAVADLTGVLTASASATQNALRDDAASQLQLARHCLDAAAARFVGAKRGGVINCAALRDMIKQTPHSSDYDGWEALPVHVRKALVSKRLPTVDALLLVNTTRFMLRTWYKVALAGLEVVKRRELVTSMQNLLGRAHKAERFETWLSFVEYKKELRLEKTRRRVKTIAPKEQRKQRGSDPMAHAVSCQTPLQGRWRRRRVAPSDAEDD